MTPDAPTHKSDAQSRVDRLRAFLAELAELEQAGVLTLSAEQRASVASHYDATVAQLAARFDVDTTESARQLSWGMRLASGLGAVALCIGIVLLAARFLGEWPTAAQMAALAAAPLVLLAAADWAARRERSLYYTALLALIAVAAFATNLEMAGMIFSVTPTQNALPALGVFALALAYHYDLRLPLLAGLIALVGWATSLVRIAHGIEWDAFYQDAETFLACGVALAAVPAVVPHPRRPLFPPLYRVAGLLTFFLAVLLLSFEGVPSWLPWRGESVARLYQFLGLVSSAGVIWLGVRRGWAGVVDLGLLFFVVFLLVRMGHWLWDEIPKWMFFFLVGLIGVALVAVFRKLRSRLAVQGAAR